MDGRDEVLFAAECDAWARHVLLGEAPPGTEAGTESGSSASAERAYGDLRQFFTSRRKQESRFVQSAVGELKGALLDVVDHLWQVAQEDSREDEEILGLLGDLADTVAKKTPQDLRTAIGSTVREISGKLEKRERRRKEQLKLLDERVQCLEVDLDEAKAEAYIDPLTRLKNRAGLDEGLKKRLLYSSLTGDKISALMIDIDFFKKINDQYGHPGGDAFLSAFSDLLVQNFPRKRDLVARYGGEEFAVVLPDANEKDAKRLADRFRKSVEKLRVDYEGQMIKTTCSIGVACFNRRESPEELVTPGGWGALCRQRRRPKPGSYRGLIARNLCFRGLDERNLQNGPAGEGYKEGLFQKKTMMKEKV